MFFYNDLNESDIERSMYELLEKVGSEIIKLIRRNLDFDFFSNSFILAVYAVVFQFAS